MNTLYLDCSMGAAGDMLAAALLELIPDPDGFIEEMNGCLAPLSGVKVKRERTIKSGVSGTLFSVTINGESEVSEDVDLREDWHSHHPNCSHSHKPEAAHKHGHASGKISDIEAAVELLKLPANVKQNIMQIYKLIADAESTVHGVPVADIHFHEIGRLDAITDIASVCMLIDRLAPDEIAVSNINTGSGHIKCAHGILPVPAPATAIILEGLPAYGSDIKGELCTPTGAALLRHFADRFSEMPLMKLRKVGYGIGKKDFSVLNCVRAIIGDTENPADIIAELSCNVDDMTGEEIGFATERLLEEGALDVYTVPIGMKKSRPGTLIEVICAEKDRNKLVSLIFAYTTTIGIREVLSRRYVLERSITDVETSLGVIRKKNSSGYGTVRSKYEYEDISRIAKEKNLSLKDIKNIIPPENKNDK